MAKEFRFFTLKEDLLEILSDIEEIKKVKYVKNGAYDKKEYVIYKSIAEFEDLGINRSGDHNSPLYLVLNLSDPIISEGEIQNKTREINE